MKNVWMLFVTSVPHATIGFCGYTLLCGAEFLILLPYPYIRGVLDIVLFAQSDKLIVVEEFYIIREVDVLKYLKSKWKELKNEMDKSYASSEQGGLATFFVILILSVFIALITWGISYEKEMSCMY